MTEGTPTGSQPGLRERVSDKLLFASNFLRHPHMLGSVIPSSRYLVNTVLASVDWAHARVIVEYGPGVGTFTGEILAHMRSDARLVVIETNGDFVQFIANAFPDNRLRIEHDSAENVQRVLKRNSLQRASCIVSGIPLGSMSRELQARICTASREALEHDGAFLVYQFTSRVLPVLRQSLSAPTTQIRTAQYPARPGVHRLNGTTAMLSFTASGKYNGDCKTLTARRIVMVLK